MAISKKERKKALFITEYRKLCEKYGMMVSIEEGDDEQYDPITGDLTIDVAFTLVEVESRHIDQAIQQLLIEDVRELEEDV